MRFKVPLPLHPNSFGKGSLPKPHELLKSLVRYVKYTAVGLICCGSVENAGTSYFFDIELGIKDIKEKIIFGHNSFRLNPNLFQWF